MEELEAPIATDIAVLREMVRLAEQRRIESLEGLERVNRYNLALIAFSGSFLSLLVSTSIARLIVQVAGFNLILSVLVSLYAIRPKTFKGGALTIEDDVALLRENSKISLNAYLLDVADLTNTAATEISRHAKNKRKWTVVSVALLAFALCITYTLYAYA